MYGGHGVEQKEHKYRALTKTHLAAPPGATTNKTTVVEAPTRGAAGPLRAAASTFLRMTLGRGSLGGAGSLKHDQNMIKL